MKLFATRAIKAGEEITFEYVSPEQTRETRRAQLRETYYFECECHICNQSPQAIKASDAARLEMQALWKNNENRFMQRCSNPAWSAQQITNAAQRLIELHEKESLRDWHQVSYNDTLAILHAMIEDEAGWKKFGKRSLKWYEQRHHPTNIETWRNWMATPNSENPFWGLRKGQKARARAERSGAKGWNKVGWER